jgi:SAM-dependent methyltransferase
MIRVTINKTKITSYRDNFFNKVTGTHPKTNPFHHQWAMNHLLFNFAKSKLNGLKPGTSILDVGVGSAPYWKIRMDLDWIGLDVEKTPNTNFVIENNKAWPVSDKSFDSVLCTQVLEHVEEPFFIVEEISRVLRPGGIVILNAPFLYPFHGMPADNARYTTTQLKYLFRDFQVIECGNIGGVGSSLATILLNFLNYKLSKSLTGQIFKIFLSPIWFLTNFFINITLISLDALDNTDSFPTNTYIIARKT